MDANGPIGVFDSGVGGLSVLFEIERLLPNEDLLYYADTLRCPWGLRSPAEIRALAAAAAEHLVTAGAKVIVVACNSASTVALADLRAAFPVPFVGTVPAIKPAAQLSRSGQIVVLGTAATVGASSVRDLIDRFAADRAVIAQACPDRLVELVEAGRPDDPAAETILDGLLTPWLARGADTVVLGCTHYAFLREAVERIAGPAVQVIETGQPVARQVRRVLAEGGLLRPDDRPGRVEYRASGDSAGLARLADRLREWYHGRVAGRS